MALGKLNIKKKVQTGMQSVMCLFRNIATLNIIDIVDQQLKATVAWVTYSSPCGLPVMAKLQRGYFPQEERLKR